MRHRSLTLLFASLALLSGCTRDIAKVGSVPISERDLELRAQVSEIYYPGSGKRHVALAQLVKGYLALEVLKASGHAVDDVVLEAEARRIDQNTKAPAVLNRIKAVYGTDRAGYLRTFVRVVYAERVLYGEVFPVSKDALQRTYDDWFWERAREVRVRIRDAALKEEFLREVSWAKQVRME